jgi:hypothetical protein
MIIIISFTLSTYWKRSAITTVDQLNKHIKQKSYIRKILCCKDGSRRLRTPTPDYHAER